MLTIRGSLLKFDKKNGNGSIIPNDARITIPDKCPLCFDFHTDHCIGEAKVEKSETGLDLVAGYIYDAPSVNKDTLKELISSGAGLGGYYNMVTFEDNNRVVKSCKLRCVSIVLKPVNPELTFEIVEDENDSTKI